MEKSALKSFLIVILFVLPFALTIEATVARTLQDSISRKHFQNASSSKHFALVHGAAHGAWCWHKLKTLLEEAGHQVTALDLAAQGRNLKPLNELQTIDDYHEPLYSFMAALSAKDRIILVGHSYGGYAVSSAMERFSSKISLAVFVTAYMVGPDLSSVKLEEKETSSLAPYPYED